MANFRISGDVLYDQHGIQVASVRDNRIYDRNGIQAGSVTNDMICDRNGIQAGFLRKDTICNRYGVQTESINAVKTAIQGATGKMTDVALWWFFVRKP